MEQITTTPQPNAVYKFERATVRIHGTCSNIKEETEKFLKQVVRQRKTARKEETQCPKAM